ncbi:hypothetical protein [Psychrobacillus sp. FSL K6-2843]|uniref:hypothetical protein n=1 Tax=Psychrobacillus sp. FSL K6-2843 TaxID=2921549 RepID=UPI00315AB139
MGDYEYKVAWCPICSQGWLEIVKDTATDELFVLCSECENEWDSPLKITISQAREEVSENLVSEPTKDEIISVKWDKYILEE